MGILKDAIRKVVEKTAKESGHDIRFLDTPVRVIETPAQAKQHDMELVEGKFKSRKYEREVYTHNPDAYRMEDRNETLYLYVVDESTNEGVAYISICKTGDTMEVVSGASFGAYKMYSPKPHSQYWCALTRNNINRAVEYLQRKYPTDRHQFIITRRGATEAQDIRQGK